MLRKKIEKNPVAFWLTFFILVIYFEPQLFKEDIYMILPMIDKVYKVLKLVGFSIISVLYIENCTRKSEFLVSKLLILVVLHQILGAVSTVINNGDIIRFSGPAITTIAMVMIAELLIKNNQLFDMLKCANIYFRFCFVLNIISIILVDFFNILPGQSIYFLGIDNRWIFTYLPWITFEFIIGIKENNIKKAICIYVLTEITLIYKWSVGAMFGSLLWLLILINNKKIIKNSVKIYLGTLIVNISIVFFKIQNYFEFILKNILHKSLTLSGRTFLWDKIIYEFKNLPWFGIGMQTIEFDKNYFVTSYGIHYDFLAVSHAHNSYMTILYRYGICGIVTNIAIWILAMLNIKKNFNSRYAVVLFIALLVTLLLAIFDTVDYSGLYFIIAMVCLLNKIEESEEKNG